MIEEPQPNDFRQILSHSLYSILSPLKAIRTKVLNGVHWVDTRIRGEENIFIAWWWQIKSPHYKKFLLSFAVCVGVLVVVGIILIPQRQVAPWRNKLENYKNHPHLEIKEYLKLENDARKLENDARTTLVQAFGGLALLIGLYFTAKTWRTTQEGQVTDRFTKAINQLGEAGLEKLAIRLGGIYALERIARDSERDHWPIMEILTAYVREHAPWPPKAIPLLADDLSPTEKSPEGKDQSQPKPAPDIQAILTVLGRRTRIFSKGVDQRLDLARTSLRRANLAAAQLQGANLAAAQLQGANLERAQLQGANLAAAQLQGANLERAQLQRANLRGAQLQRANLAAAQLQRADFWRAQLQGADLLGAQLQWAKLQATRLQGAKLWGAQLQGAFFVRAELQGADLLDAQLEGARNLTVGQLSTVQTLYRAHLDPPLLEQIRQQYPQLLEDVNI